MNGQLYNLLKITNCLNEHIVGKNVIYENDKYINTLTFMICKELRSLFNKILNRQEMDRIGLEKFMHYLHNKSCRYVLVDLEVKDNDRTLSLFANGVS